MNYLEQLVQVNKDPQQEERYHVPQRICLAGPARHLR